MASQERTSLMPELAFDGVISEFLWLGLSSKSAHNLASLLYPEESLMFEGEDDLEEYANMVFDYYSFKFEDFGFESDYLDRKDAINRIRGTGEYKKVMVYIDGANLARSLAYIKEKNYRRDSTLVRKVSIETKNYRTPDLNNHIPLGT